MKIISVINYKGGVGKTTLVANIGAELAARGYKILMIDMDAQASLTFSFMRPETWVKRFATDATIKEWFRSIGQAKAPSLSSLRWRVNTYKNGGQLDLIPSHLELIDVDLELATELGGANLRQAKMKFLNLHGRLADGLRESSMSDVEIVLIDCPPSFNIVTKTAIVASEFVLIPAKPDSLSTMGIDYLRRSLNQLVSDYNEYAAVSSEGDHHEPIDPEILGVVFTMVQQYGGVPVSAQRPHIAQTKALGLHVFKRWIRENKTVYGSAPANTSPVVLNSDAYSAQFVSELEELVDELVGAAGL